MISTGFFSADTNPLSYFQGKKFVIRHSTTLTEEHPTCDPSSLPCGTPVSPHSLENAERELFQRDEFRDMRENPIRLTVFISVLDWKYSSQWWEGSRNAELVLTSVSWRSSHNSQPDHQVALDPHGRMPSATSSACATNLQVGEVV